MTIDIFKITQSESEIMELLWASAKPMTIEQIAGMLKVRRGRRPAPSTINTLAARLVQKGLAVYVQIDGHNLYAPLISAEEYRAFVVNEFLNVLYQGSFAEMVSSLLKGGYVSRETLSILGVLINSALKEDTGDDAETEEMRETPKSCGEIALEAGNCIKVIGLQLSAWSGEGDDRKKTRQRTSCIPRAS